MHSRSVSFGFSFLAAVSLFAAEPIDIGNRRQLLIDSRFIESRRNIELHVHSPRKTGEVVVQSQKPWTLGGYSSVLKDRDTYHLWYMVGGNVGHIRSKDGIHWESPAPGSNIVLGSGHGGIKGAVNGLMVFLDPKAPAGQRFRLICNPHEEGQMLQVFSSPDGDRWTRTYRDVLKYTDPKHHLDSQNTIIWDDRLGKYVAYVRRNLRSQGSPMRSIARAESPTLEHFPDVEQTQVVFRPDARDPEYAGGISAIDWYTNGAIRYPWAENVHLMFPVEYLHYGKYLGDFRDGAPVNAGSLDARFASSRDGVAWERYSRLSMLENFSCGRVVRLPAFPSR